jgi:mannose-1-phosphate guanylyltransferase
MVAAVQGLLEIIENAMPDLYRSFSRLSSLFQTHAEMQAIEDLYERIDETNFSHQVLTLHPEQLAVLRVTGVRWNDLGEPKRVMASLHMAGIRPGWANGALPQFA